MQWFRAKLKAGAGLALFALTVQIVVSFGHVHLGRFAHAAPYVTSTSTPSTSPAPNQPPAGDPNDYCAICATIHLTGSSFLPEGPRVPIPVAAQLVEHFNPVTAVFIEPRRAPFQSRAPPPACAMVDC
jgi:hypothetical protein